MRVQSWVFWAALCGIFCGCGTASNSVAALNLSPEGANCVSSKDCQFGLSCFGNVCAKGPADVGADALVAADVSTSDAADAVEELQADAVPDALAPGDVQPVEETVATLDATAPDDTVTPVPDVAQVPDVSLDVSDTATPIPDVAPVVDVAPDVGGSDAVSLTCGASGAPMLQDTFGGPGDQFQGVIPATGGGWLFFGTTATKGAGGQDAWIVRTDASLGLLWEKTFGTTKDDNFTAGVGHADGSFTFVGNRGQGSGVMSTDGQVWAVHVDASGKQLWEFAGGGGAKMCNAGNGIAINDQGVVIAGASGTTYTGGTFSSACASVGWIVQFDLAGNQLWEAKPTGTTSLTAVGALDSGIVVVGKSATDLFAKRLKAGGTVVWSTSFIGQATSLVAMTLLADGNLALAGRQGTAVQSPQFRAVLDTAGGFVWQTGVLGTTGIPSSLAETSFGLVSATIDPGGIVATSKDNGAFLWMREVKWKSGGAYLHDVRPAGAGLVAAGYKNGVGAWALLLGPDGSAGCECTDTCNSSKACMDDWCTLGKCTSTLAAAGTSCKTATNVGTCDASGGCKSLCTNNKCDKGETYASCPVDCIPTCGNGTCDSGENLPTCPTDCSNVCGNGVCDSGETVTTCPADCFVSGHFCDTHCDKQGTGCFCDSACKGKGDCCNSAGTAKVGNSCAGSTCASCK